MDGYEIVKDAMKDVIQELIVVDESGVHHLVFVHKIEMVDGKLVVDFSSPSEYTSKLDGLVNDAMNAQIKELLAENSKKTMWGKIKSWLRLY